MSTANPDLHLNIRSSSSKKTNYRLLSFLVQALVMTIVSTCLFLFVGLASVLLLLIQICISNSDSIRHRPLRFPEAEADLGCSRRELCRLPSSRYAAGSGDECVVCLLDLARGEWFRILPDCGHRFHVDCIDKWLIKARFCPTCRRCVRLTVDSSIGGG